MNSVTMFLIVLDETSLKWMKGDYEEDGNTPWISDDSNFGQPYYDSRSQAEEVIRGRIEGYSTSMSRSAPTELEKWKKSKVAEVVISFTVKT